VLEWERLAREEALGRLQQERTTLEGAQATLKQREDEVSKLNGELVQLNISHEDLRHSLKEQETTVCDLRREAEEARKALEVEKKQVEGGLSSIRFSLVDLPFGDPLPTFLFLFVAFRPAGRLGEFDNPSPSHADGLQLLTTGVGGVAGHRTRGLPGG
jgi:hypothetical protein